MADELTPQEEQLLRKVVARASEQGWGVAFGALCGLGLFFATVILVVKGGPNPGPHLGVLGAYFPGYQVTLGGSVIGLLYASVLGYVLGRSVATLYNRMAR